MHLSFSFSGSTAAASCRRSASFRTSAFNFSFGCSVLSWSTFFTDLSDLFSERLLYISVLCRGCSDFVVFSLITFLSGTTGSFSFIVSISLFSTIFPVISCSFNFSGSVFIIVSYYSPFGVFVCAVISFCAYG